MISSQSTSLRLVVLSKHGELQQLSSALEQPSIAQVALGTMSVVLDAVTGRSMDHLTLERMIHAASKTGQADTVEFLLRFGQRHDVAASEMVTMDTLDAAVNEDPLAILLKFKAVDPDAFSRTRHLGTSLISIACHGGPNEEDCPRNKYLGLVQYLMATGVDPNTPNARPGTRRYRPGRLLQTACWQASCEIVECLLQHGAMIKGSRSMRRASANGRIDVLEALLKYGGDVNEVADCKDIDGPPGTALHAAADAQNEEAVRWLLAHGADDTLKNKDGISAREIMEDKGMVV